MRITTYLTRRLVHGIELPARRHRTGLGEQAQAMLELPDVNANKGLRDRAILALLVGCGEGCSGEGRVLRAVNKGDVVSGDEMMPQAIVARSTLW